MSAKTHAIVVALLTIALGTGWLLTARNVLPGVNWVWVLALGVVGILVLALGGIDKVTVVVGPLLMLATGLSLLRQTNRLDVNTEVPCLVIALGLLMLLATVLPIPAPRWFSERPDGPA